MKKIFKLSFLFILITFGFMSINVYAEVSIESDDIIGIFSNEDEYVNEVYVSSGKKMSLNIKASSSRFVFYDMVASDVKSNNIKVNLNTSGGVSCNISNVANNYYTFSNNMYTLNNINTPFEEVFGFNIGHITCNFPTTSSFTKLSGNMSLTINLEYTDVDIAFDTPTEERKNETYIFHFGIINENYYNSLNDSPSITSVTVNGNNYDEVKVNDIYDDTLQVKINQNNFASKNRLHLEFGNETTQILDENLSSNEKNISMPYGVHYVSISEDTEKSIFIFETIYSDNFPKFIGFPDDFFSYSSNGNEHNFIFNRIDTRSKINTLKTLSVSNATINFNPDLKNYFVTVPYNVSSVVINSTLTDAKSSYVSGLGNRTVNLNVGDNYIEVKVRAENGSEASYNIRVTREKNNDSSLKSIKVDDHEIIVKDKILLYTLKVDNEIVKPVITAVANDTEAKIEIDPIEELKEGENKINIIVTAADNTKTNYVVNIIRDKLISTNSKIKKLTIKNHDILFDSETFNYKVKLDKDEEKLDINVETSNNKATYLITGNKDLMNKSVIKIKVTAEDQKTVSTYTIEIEKEVKNRLNYIPYIIFGIGCIAIALVLSLKKKNKKNNNEVTNNIEPINNIDSINNNSSNTPNNFDYDVNHNVNSNVNNNVNNYSSNIDNVEIVKKNNLKKLDGDL